MVHAELARHGLQLAVVVCNADGADMRSLSQQRLDNHFAVFFEPDRVGCDFHAHPNGR